MGVGNVEQFRVAVGVGLHQLANVGVARGDSPGKGRADGLVVFQRRQPCIVRFGGLRVGFRRSGVGQLLVSFLTRHRMAVHQVLPARRGGRGELGIGLLLQHMCVSLCQLLVKIGAVNHRQYLTGLYLAANVAGPAFQVTVHPCVNRRLAPGFQMRGQAQGVAVGVLQRLEHVDHGQGGGFGPTDHRLFMPAARGEAIGDQQRGQCQAADAQQHQALARRFLIRRHG